MRLINRQGSARGEPAREVLGCFAVGEGDSRGQKALGGIVVGVREARGVRGSQATPKYKNEQ